MLHVGLKILIQFNIDLLCSISAAKLPHLGLKTIPPFDKGHWPLKKGACL